MNGRRPSYCLKKTSFSISDDLYSAARIRAETLGYDSYSEYVNGLMRADMLLRKTHKLPLSIKSMVNTERDKVDAAILANEQGVPYEITPDEQVTAAHIMKGVAGNQAGLRVVESEPVLARKERRRA